MYLLKRHNCILVDVAQNLLLGSTSLSSHLNVYVFAVLFPIDYIPVTLEPNYRLQAVFLQYLIFFYFTWACVVKSICFNKIFSCCLRIFLRGSRGQNQLSIIVLKLEGNLRVLVQIIKTLHRIHWKRHFFQGFRLLRLNEN